MEESENNLCLPVNTLITKHENFKKPIQIGCFHLELKLEGVCTHILIYILRSQHSSLVLCVYHIDSVFPKYKRTLIDFSQKLSKARNEGPVNSTSCQHPNTHQLAQPALYLFMPIQS